MTNDATARLQARYKAEDAATEARTITPAGELSAAQASMLKELRRAWFVWEQSGRKGTAWDFLNWYERRLRGPKKPLQGSARR